MTKVGELVGFLPSGRALLRSWLALLALVLVAGCSGLPPPPERHVAADGYDIYYEPNVLPSVESFAAELAPLDSSIAAVFGTKLDRGELRVLMDETFFRTYPVKDVNGFYATRLDTVVLRQSTLEPSTLARSTLAHELVHRHSLAAHPEIRGRRWIVEGLAVALALEHGLEPPRARAPVYLSTVYGLIGQRVSGRVLADAGSWEGAHDVKASCYVAAGAAMDRLIRDERTAPTLRDAVDRALTKAVALDATGVQQLLARAAGAEWPQRDDYAPLYARGELVDALRRIDGGPRVWIDAMLPLAERDARTRASLATILRHRDRSHEGSAAESKLLRQLADDPDPGVRFCATSALVMRDELPLTELISRLDLMDAVPHDRSSFGDASFVEALEPLLVYAERDGTKELPKGWASAAGWKAWWAGQKK